MESPGQKSGWKVYSNFLRKGFHKAFEDFRPASKTEMYVFTWHWLVLPSSNKIHHLTPSDLWHLTSSDMIISPDREEAEETADPSEAKLKRLVLGCYECSVHVDFTTYHVCINEWISHVTRPVFRDIKHLQNIIVMKTSLLLYPKYNFLQFGKCSQHQ